VAPQPAQPRPAERPSPLRRRLASAAIASWLAVQIALPVRGLLLDAYQTRGRFSWNMYAHRYPCEAGYRYDTADGRRIAVNPARALRLPERIAMLYREDSLAALHEHLCATLARREGPGRLRGSVRCTLDHREPRVFLRPEADPCASRRAQTTRDARP